MTLKIPEKRIHEIFRLSVLLKGAHALLECITGLALALVSVDTIARTLTWLTQDELTEDPHDSIANYFLNAAHTFDISTKSFYSFYLLSHGIVKLFLVAGLLREKLWAYPTSLVVLGLFMVYQVYRYIYLPSVGLIVLTVFDLFVMVLVWHEYSLMRRRLPTQ
jgi:uncharacterized membrane protein